MENNSNHQGQPRYPQQMGNQQRESVSEFNQHKFPLRRVMGITKSDPDVGMVSAEAETLLSKACEMFLADLTMHSWLHADENKGCMLQRSDIFTAVARTSTFDFLVDFLHKDESRTANPCFVAIPSPKEAGSDVENETGENEGGFL